MAKEYGNGPSFVRASPRTNEVARSFCCSAVSSRGRANSSCLKRRRGPQLASMSRGTLLPIRACSRFPCAGLPRYQPCTVLHALYIRVWPWPWFRFPWIRFLLSGGILPSVGKHKIDLSIPASSPRDINALCFGFFTVKVAPSTKHFAISINSVLVYFPRFSVREAPALAISIHSVFVFMTNSLFCLKASQSALCFWRKLVSAPSLHSG